ncbi:LuxR C-terminal-related transcriptional regulator [Streptomyces sp. NPDC005077]|uniref:LuxR C-terminal-related transcriptional regulator n=1 Tax=Streptomyces sp. NPDC005077 TaxID=3154292 RepID=UPI0033AB770E
MHAAFFLLLGASLARFLLRHPGEDRTPWIIALSVALAALYLLGPVLGSRPTPRRLARLGVLVAVWMVLVVLAPSFAWCAVPLFFTGLRLLPPRAALALVALLTVFVVAAQLRLAHGFDPNLVLAPPAVAATATAVFVHMQRQAVRQRELIDDLLRTRRELAATERREGTLAEGQRLSMEIHDTLAQGLSSQQMLLQAADRTWDADPATARRHVRTATGIAERNLAEARRFVHDLAPADLAEGGGLEAALSALATRETTQAHGLLTVRCHVEGDTDADITRAIEAGATGYLLKAERPEELFAAIRSAAQGRTTLSPPVASRVMARMRSPLPTLTDRERDILGQLSQGLGNRDIARALFISEATVKTHLGRIYDKLGVDTRAGAVSVAKEQRLLP